VFGEKQELPQTDAAFGKLMKSGNLMKFTLGDTIMSFRDNIIDKFIKDFADDTYENYLSWMKVQSNRFNAITDINDGFPTELAGMIKFYVNKEWNMAVDAFLGAGKITSQLIENLSEIDDRATRYRVDIDKTDAAEEIRLAINKDLLELGKDLNNEKLVDAIITKLKIVENLSIPLHFHQVQDRFYLIYKRIINDIYPYWFGSGSPLGKDRNMINLINRLAKEFRFNTDKTAT